MSLHDYQVSRRIATQDAPFASLIMAAVAQADTDNLERLSLVFPKLVAEAQARSDAPGGRLPSDPDGAP